MAGDGDGKTSAREAFFPYPDAGPEPLRLLGLAELLGAPHTGPEPRLFLSPPRRQSNSVCDCRPPFYQLSLNKPTASAATSSSGTSSTKRTSCAQRCAIFSTPHTGQQVRTDIAAR